MNLDALAGSAQVDVFSLGVVLHELFAKSSASALILRSGTHEECMVFAYKVPPNVDVSFALLPPHVMGKWGKLYRPDSFCSCTMCWCQMGDKCRAPPQVVGGYRRPMPAWWPQQLRDLISDCWAADPARRPSMLAVARRLLALQASGWDATP